MKKNLIGLAVATTLGLVTLSAAAEDMYRGAWYLVPGASIIHPDNDLDAKNGGGAFIRLGKEISENWDVQFGGSYARANNDLSGVGGRYRQTLLGVDALYMFSRDKFRPFLLAGVGAARNNVDYTNVDNGKKTSLMGNVGVGMQYLFTDNFGLQADLRQVWSRAEAKPALFNKKTVSNTYLNLGAIFRFGAPAPVVAAAPEPEPMPMAEPMAEPAPVVAEPMPAAPACKPTMETVTVSAEKLFGFDKAKLQNGAKPILDEAAAKIKANPGIGLVMVTGYTDRIGSDAYNNKLSQRRANIVKDYLVSQGVQASSLQAVGKGEADPVVTCSDKNRSKLIECLAPNRRVVISAETQRESGCN